MKRSQNILQTLMALVMVAGLWAPAALAVQQGAASRLQPALARVVAEAPDQLVRVIVQKADTSAQAEALVEELGGQILKDLPLINAFAAKLPTEAVGRLGTSDFVMHIALDAPVVSTAKGGGGGNRGGSDGGYTTVSFTVRDEFNLPAYSNSDGSVPWTSDWAEHDDDGTPTSGQIFVDGNQRLHLENKDFGALESVQRIADLTEAISATLTFDYNGFGEGGLDIFAVDVSADGTNFTTLTTVEVVGPVSGGLAFNLSGVVDFTANFTIRFRLVQGFAATTQFIAFDNVQIQFDQQVNAGLPENVFLDTLGVRDVWAMGYRGAGIGVAVIDSGISSDRDLNLVYKTSLNASSNTVNDVYGHGTHVAGIIGGNGTDSAGQYQGVAPEVGLISLKISDETGMAYESDTVDAMQWVFDNKDQYNIRVVNLSIQSTVEQSYHDSALAAAAEILWFNGVVVVAATGNWYAGNIYPLNAAPGNDPFIITVGAVDEKGSTRINDDRITTFSVWGLTQDGFMKPEIFAPGVDIISVLSRNSSWDIEHPDRTVFGHQYVRISGTSMATPMVSGAVALLLQAEPGLTPDQVKYRVMNAHEWVGSSKYLNVYKMLTTLTTESANQDVVPHMLLAKMAMLAYWASENGGETIDWGAVNWNSVNWDSVNWDSVNWDSVNWDSVNWNAVNWNAVNWNAVNWNAVNWNAVNWNAVNWNSVNWNAVNWNSVNWNSTYWGE